MSPVEDLELNFTLNNYFIISWSPPEYQSSDVSTMSLTYEALVINSEGVPILNATVSNTSIILTDITECDTFNVSITATIGQHTSKVNSAVGENAIQSK